MKYELIEHFPEMDFLDIGFVVNVEKTEEGEYRIDDLITVPGNVLYKHFKKKRLDGFKYSPYSFSKMESWKSCAKKFEFNYIIKPPLVTVPSPILEKGTLFHAILEHDVVDKLREFDIPDKFEALDEIAAEQIIIQALGFTNEKIYKQIKNTPGIKVPEIEMFLGKGLIPVEDESDALIKGFIDLLIIDEENRVAYIYDWKTGGKNIETLKKWPRPKDQLELYSIWALQVFNIDKVQAGYVYVEHNYMSEYTFGKKVLDSLKEKFLVTIEHIEQDTKFKQKITKLCDWCDYKPLCFKEE